MSGKNYCTNQAYLDYSGKTPNLTACRANAVSTPASMRAGAASVYGNDMGDVLWTNSSSFLGEICFINRPLIGSMNLLKTVINFWSSRRSEENFEGGVTGIKPTFRPTCLYIIITIHYRTLSLKSRKSDGLRLYDRADYDNGC
ncbi:hypothetical protein C8R44DRAFT_745694 [Mycena epipterygia]|nr:hypothetical protein C8R44DRAFT_745694 [Mycena epipterygia]